MILYKSQGLTLPNVSFACSVKHGNYTKTQVTLLLTVIMKVVVVLVFALAATALAFPHSSIANQETSAAGGVNATVMNSR